MTLTYAVLCDGNITIKTEKYMSSISEMRRILCMSFVRLTALKC